MSEMGNTKILLNSNEGGISSCLLLLLSSIERQEKYRLSRNDAGKKQRNEHPSIYTLLLFALICSLLCNVDFSLFFSVLDGVLFAYLVCVASQNMCYFGCTRNDHCNVIMKNFLLPNFEWHIHMLCTIVHTYVPPSKCFHMFHIRSELNFKISGVQFIERIRTSEIEQRVKRRNSLRNEKI